MAQLTTEEKYKFLQAFGDVALTQQITDNIDSKVSNDGSEAFSADQSMGGNKLTDLAEPTDASDAATKEYVDNSSGGGAAWGAITGTLSNQTDLQTALNTAGDEASWGNVTGTLSSQTDLQSALDSAEDTAEWGSVTGTLSAQTDLQAALDEKVTTDSDATLLSLSTPNVTVPSSSDFPATSGYAIKRTIYALVDQDITYNLFYEDATVAYTAGGTQGNEVVTIVDHAISVQIDDGVSTATNIEAALDAYEVGDPGSLTELVAYTITGTAENAQDVHAALAGEATVQNLLVVSAYTDGNPQNEELDFYYTDPFETSTNILTAYQGRLALTPPPTFAGGAGVIALNANVTLQANLTYNAIFSTFAYYTPTTGATINLSPGGSKAIIDPAGTLAALTVNLPTAAGDGHVYRISSSEIITTLTLGAAMGDSIKTATTAFTAGGSVEYTYQLSNTTWYKTGS